MLFFYSINHFLPFLKFILLKILELCRIACFIFILYCVMLFLRSRPRTEGALDLRQPASSDRRPGCARTAQVPARTRGRAFSALRRRTFRRPVQP